MRQIVGICLIETLREIIVPGVNFKEVQLGRVGYKCAILKYKSDRRRAHRGEHDVIIYLNFRCHLRALIPICARVPELSSMMFQLQQFCLLGILTPFHQAPVVILRVEAHSPFNRIRLILHSLRSGSQLTNLRSPIPSVYGDSIKLSPFNMHSRCF